MKVYKYDTKDLMVEVSYKIDGVKAIKTKDGWLSRAGKPLYNLPKADDGVYEVFLGEFKSTISAVKTYDGELIHKDCLYMLEPKLDDRLFIDLVPSEEVKPIFNGALAMGYEGLVVKDTRGLFKLKNHLTFDCVLVGLQEGNGKYTGKLGALIVKLEDAFFKVGTGLTDQDRLDLMALKFGTIIEVEGMELLPSGKLRHPRFIRVRDDLTGEL
jgi:hypothetical protein